jgi:hypothetical protein
LIFKGILYICGNQLHKLGLININLLILMG